MGCCASSETQKDYQKPRGCTDVLCLAIFCIFWGLLIFVAAFALVIGNPIRLLNGQDSFGNTCGVQNVPLGNLTFSGMDMTDRPYLFFLNVSNLRQSLKICVKKCPNRQLSDNKEIEEFEKETGSTLCRYDVSSYKKRSKLYPSVNNATIENIFIEVEEKSGHHLCPVPPVYDTKPLLNRCIPKPVASLATDIVYNFYAYLNSVDTIQQIVSDIYAGWREIIWMICLALVLSFIVTFTIHWFASLVSWIIMFVTSLSALIGTGFLWWTYIEIKYKLDSIPENQLLMESARNEHTFLIYAIIATVFTLILLLIVLVMRKRVKLVVKLFNEAGKCVRSMPLLLTQPLCTFLCLIIFFIFWIIVLGALATAYYPIKNNVENPLRFTSTIATPLEAPPEQQKVLGKAFSLVSFSEGSWVQYMWWYHLIALIWTSEFILGCQQMVIAGSVANWYFTRDRTSLRNVRCKAIAKLMTYHLGSVVLGSFLITLCKIPRIILTYLSSQMKKHQDIMCVSYCLKCCTCCLWCLEKCIRYLNHNAYTVIAIQGVGFCTAAQEAFNILVSNALRVATINSVGDFILFLGKCGITAITTFVGILVMKNNPELHFYAIPVLIVSIFSFFIAHCVLSVYEMVIDTLFLCCCEDLRHNDGSKEKPYYGGNIIRYFRGDEGGEPLEPLNKPDGKGGDE